MKSKKCLAFSVLVVVVVSSVNLFGISDDEKRQIEKFGTSTLKGITGIKPVVLIAHSKDVNLKLATQNVLQTEAELEFRKAGITVIDNPSDYHNGNFFVIFEIIKVENFPVYAIAVNAYLSQWVSSLREPNIITYGRTWPLSQTPDIYYAGEDKLEEAIRNIVRNEVIKFINDYLAANPKEQVATKDANDSNNH